MFICPNCNEELSFIGYEEKSGIDITSDGTIELSEVGNGEVWEDRYFCPECGYTLIVGEDIYTD